MLGGAIIPGKPVANMYFTMYGYNPLHQALALLKDLKMVSEIIHASPASLLIPRFPPGAVHKASTTSHLHGTIHWYRYRACILESFSA